MDMRATPDVSTNPLLAEWRTPHGLPPFDEIRTEHFEPAFEVAMRGHRAELDAIAVQTDAPSFDNTVAAFDRCARLLSRIEGVFYNLTASQTSPELQAVQRELAAPMAAHYSAVYMHAGVFKRIDALHAERDSVAVACRSPAAAGAHAPRFRAVRCQARGAAAGALCAGDGASGRTDHALRAERAARRSHVPVGAARRRRSGRAAAFRARRGTAGGGGPRRGQRLGDHAVALADRALPDLLRAARPARAGLARLGRARRA